MLEIALSHDWYKALNPKARASWDAYQKRKAEGKLELWERAKLGEILPNKIYMPVETNEDTKCELCGDTGYRCYIENGYSTVEECECLNAIKFSRNMKKAGADPNMNFDTFLMDQDFQKEMSMKATEFALGGYLSGQWFFAGGQVGCGKTHICTAILHELIKTNIGCKYMAWRDEAVQLKAIVNQHEEYHQKLMELCKSPVLYIDDFWKTQQGMKPTQADVNLAFQIINFRYQDKKYVTIISCEHTVKKLMEIDEAVGSRIYERSKAYRVEIEKDEAKNYRLKIG